jgi:hypothetical protein
MGVSDVIGAASWSDHDPYTDEALLDPWLGTSSCAMPVPPCGCQVRDVRPHPVRLGTACAAGLGESFPSHNGVMMNDRMNLTWWTRDGRISLNSITSLSEAGTAAAATIFLSAMMLSRR